MAETGDQALGLTSAVRAPLVPTDDGTGVIAPKEIIPNVRAARTIYFKFRNEHLERIQLYALIEGLLAGNPPYSPSELARAKLAHISNFNTLDARALYERKALAYWNAMYESEFLAKFIIRGHDPELIPWADTMARHLTRMLRSWESFYTLSNTLTAQIVKFGISPAIWPDERDWRWRVVELSKFYVSDQAQSDIGQMTCFAVETTFTAQYLFEVYEKFKDVDTKDSPWNTEELAKLLLWRANTWAKSDTQFIDVMDIQRRIQNGDIGWDVVFSDDIRLVSLFQKEYNGKISHYMFERWFDHGDFLFKERDQYQCIEDVLILFTASPGEFTIHSNRGFGHKIFSGAQAMMQLDNTMFDMAKMSATPLIQTPATGAKDFDAIRFIPGVATNIGMAEFVNNTLGANIEQVMGVSQFMRQKLSYNAANSGDDPALPDSNVSSVSPEQARMQSYREFGLPKNDIAHFYSQWDKVFRNMVIKLLKSKPGYPGYEFAEEWIARCIDDGVPKEMFEMKDTDYYGMPWHLSVRAARVAGDGSTMARIMGLQELQPIAGSFGPREEKEYKREYIMATMGPEYVDVFLQDSDDDDETAGGASLAGVENAIMQMGKAPVFSPDNEHRSHAATHLALAMHMLEGIRNQQMKATDADNVFSVLVPHNGEHVKMLQKSPFAVTFLQKYLPQWKQVIQQAVLNRKRAVQELEAEQKKQVQDQQQTQQVMDDAQRKDFTAQADAKRADFKVQSQVERAKEASDTRASVQKDGAVKKADNQRLQIQLDAANKRHEISIEPQAPDEAAPQNPITEKLTQIAGKTPSLSDFE